jgi:hypothetical protein
VGVDGLYLADHTNVEELDTLLSIIGSNGYMRTLTNAINFLEGLYEAKERAKDIARREKVVKAKVGVLPDESL